MSKETQAAVVEPDAKKREGLYQQIQRDHQKVAPFVIMFQQIEVAAHRKSVDGFLVGPGFDNNWYSGIAKH
jgi:peptide/nickel transport system substrate-binding protein